MLELNKSRIEAFTDAIVAIAATIMVLELHVPKYNDLAGLIEEWPVFLAYIISFTLIYIVWYNHHNLFQKAKNISTSTYLINGVWLFFLTLIPFFTRWVGNAPESTLPEFFYALDLLLWSLLFQVMDHQIIKDNPDAPTDPTNTVRYRTFLYLGLVLALIISFIWPLGCLIILVISIILLGIGVFVMPREIKK